jgi:hypothetical protein
VMKTLILQKIGISPGVYGGLRFDNKSLEWRLMLSEKVLKEKPGMLKDGVLSRISCDELIEAKDEHIKELNLVTSSTSIKNLALKRSAQAIKNALQDNKTERIKFLLRHEIQDGLSARDRNGAELDNSGHLKKPMLNNLNAEYYNTGELELQDGINAPTEDKQKGIFE